MGRTDATGVLAEPVEVARIRGQIRRPATEAADEVTGQIKCAGRARAGAVRRGAQGRQKLDGQGAHGQAFGPGGSGHLIDL